jgi:hypothetical protein
MELTPIQETAFDEAMNDFHCFMSEGNGCLMLRGSRKIFEAGITAGQAKKPVSIMRQFAAYILYRLTNHLPAVDRETIFSGRLTEKHN